MDKGNIKGNLSSRSRNKPFKDFLDYCSSSSFIGKRIPKERVELWLSQFEEEDRIIARILLNYIHYIDTTNLLTYCKFSFYKLIIEKNINMKKTIFIPVGGASKSGHLVCYFYRIANNLSIDKFTSEDAFFSNNLSKKIDTIIFLDDYLGTGEQAIGWWKRSRFSHLHSSKKQYYAPLIATEEGYREIQKKTSLVCTPVQMRFSKQDFVIPMSILDKEDNEEDYTLNDFLRKYGEGLFVDYGRDYYLGYGNTLSGVVFFYNTPDNVVPIIWSDGVNSRGQKWEPLFPRYSRKRSEVEVLEEALNEFNFNKNLNELDMLNAFDLLIDLYRRKEMYILPIETTYKLIRQVCLILIHSQGDGDFKIWPPMSFDFMVKIRKYLVNRLTKDLSNTEQIEKFFLPLFSIDNEMIFQDIVIIWELVQYGKKSQYLASDGLNVILDGLENENYWISRGCKNLISNIIEVSSEARKFTLNKLSYRKFVNVQSEYYRLLLLYEIGTISKIDIDNFLTKENKERIFFTENVYGKYYKRRISDGSLLKAGKY